MINIQTPIKKINGHNMDTTMTSPLTSPISMQVYYEESLTHIQKLELSVTTPFLTVAPGGQFNAIEDSGNFIFTSVSGMSTHIQTVEKIT